MGGFFGKMLGRNRDARSANRAKQRLQFVLVHDRLSLPPERVEAMKAEILEVISKYVDVNNDMVEIALEQRDRNQSRLIAEIPFSKQVEAHESNHADTEPKRLLYLEDGSDEETVETQTAKPDDD